MKLFKYNIVTLTIIFCLAISCYASVTQSKESVKLGETNSVSKKESLPTSTQELAPINLDEEASESQEEQAEENEEKSEVDEDLSLLKEHGAFVGSFLSILITEIGDKTFIVTAVLATRYSKLWVFIGSYGALFLMTLISCFIGNISLSLLNPQYIKFVAAALFFIFGFKAVYEAATNKLEDDEEEIEHDLKELDEKIAKKVYGENYHPEEENKNEGEENNNNENKDLEQSLLKSQSKQNKANLKAAVPNTYIAAQTFAQNFLGEWGDRSQISTIAMSASFDFFKVFLGCALGHAACSYLAITGGKLLAEKFSERTLTLAGGILFIIYGIATLFTI